MAEQQLVVVGASLAGVRAVDGARRAGFSGPITLIGAEPHLPYDRPPLSKAFLDAGQEPAPPTLRTEQVLRDKLGVRLELGAAATGLDTEARTVLVGERAYPYTAAVIATGAVARPLPWLADLPGVYPLRTLDDARRIRAAMDAGGRVVVVGAGFIGSEVAAAARRRGLDVTVVELLPAPMVHAVGEPIGLACANLHRRGGTRLRCGAGVSAVLGDGRVQRVALADGTELPADVVVVGAGAVPAAGWLAGSGLAVEDGVLCDERLCAAPGVYAAGDVARWQHPLLGRSLRVEHWTNAAEQGMAAGRNAADPAGAAPYAAVPYFWSDWYGTRIQFAGLPTAEVHVVDGDTDGDYLVALYRQPDPGGAAPDGPHPDGPRLAGAITLNAPAEIMRYRTLIQQGGSWADALELAGTRRAARLAASA